MVMVRPMHEHCTKEAALSMRASNARHQFRALKQRAHPMIAMEIAWVWSGTSIRARTARILVTATAFFPEAQSRQTDLDSPDAQCNPRCA